MSALFTRSRMALIAAAFLLAPALTVASAPPAKADVSFGFYVGPGYSPYYGPYGHRPYGFYQRPYGYYQPYGYYNRPYEYYGRSYYRPNYYAPRYYRKPHRHYRAGNRSRWCHSHSYKVRGIKRHRNVRCHKHRNWRHRSLVY